MPTSAAPDNQANSEPPESETAADSANPAAPKPARPTPTVGPASASPRPIPTTPKGVRPTTPRATSATGSPASSRLTPSGTGTRPTAAGNRASGAAGTRKPLPPRKPPAKAWWTKQFYLWHWVSSAVCLASMLVFSFTGVTLNHADQIPAQPQITERSAALPAELLATIAPGDDEDEVKKPLPAPLRHWLDKELGIYVGGRSFEWSPEEIYVDLPRPGGDGWMTIDRESGEIVHEVTRRGWISYLNDLHKGRHTGTAWSWYMDIFAIACVVFTLTGLCLLYVHAKRRPTTWPVVLGGIVLPIIILIFFAHI